MLYWLFKAALFAPKPYLLSPVMKTKLVWFLDVEEKYSEPHDPVWVTPDSWQPWTGDMIELDHRSHIVTTNKNIANGNKSSETAKA